MQEELIILDFWSYIIYNINVYDIFVILFITWILNLTDLVSHYSIQNKHTVGQSIFFDDLKLYKILQPIGSVSGLRTIEIVDNPDLVDVAVHALITGCVNYPILGIDCEMKSRRNRHPSIQLLQLSTIDGYVALFRTTFLNHIPQSLAELLSNEGIWKVGVAVYDDVRFLLEQYPDQFVISGTLDLRYLAYYFGVPERGLKSLAFAVLKIKMSTLHTGEWDDIELSTTKALYAAVDAYIGILLFDNFFQRYKSKALKQEATFLSEKELIKKFCEMWSHKISKQFSNDYMITSRNFIEREWSKELIFFR